MLGSGNAHAVGGVALYHLGMVVAAIEQPFNNTRSVDVVSGMHPVSAPVAPRSIRLAQDLFHTV